MITKYDKRYIFNLLKHQIQNRVTWTYPYNNPYEKSAELFWDSVCENGIMYLNKVRLPDIRWYDWTGWYSWPMMYADSLLIHHLFDDDYSQENVLLLENLGIEGPYGFENVVVKKGDIVIDAGAYIGDWSAVADKMGGKVYAFEPSPTPLPWLKKTAELNNFKIVQLGLGDKVCEKMINIDLPIASQEISDTTGTPCDITTLDAYTEENNIHVDFIKSDIEGYEYNMLIGASRVLREDCPKLAIRTYHHPDDPTKLSDLVKSINPEYKIIMRRKTLFAYID